MKPHISQLSKRISLSPIVNIHASAYKHWFGSRIGRFLLTLSYLLLYLVAMQYIYNYNKLQDPSSPLAACFGIAIPIALTFAYVITLLFASIMVVRTSKRVRAAASEPILYTGHSSVLLSVLECEALALGQAGRSIRFLRPNGKAYYILRVTTYAPYMGYPGIHGFPRRIYFILENAGDKTWNVCAIEHLLFWNRGIRIILTRSEAKLKQWAIPQWLSQVVAIANMKEARFLRGE
jgi:hypothetical protein